MGIPGCRIVGGVLPAVPSYADVGPFSATVSPTAWLYCSPCGSRLWYGATTTGAEVYFCRTCRLVVDSRRIA